MDELARTPSGLVVPPTAQAPGDVGPAYQGPSHAQIQFMMIGHSVQMKFRNWRWLVLRPKLDRLSADWTTLPQGWLPHHLEERRAKKAALERAAVKPGISVRKRRR